MHHGSSSGQAIEFGEVDCGWMMVRIGDFEQAFSGVVYPSMADTVDALIRLLSFGDGAAVWWTKPTEYEFRFLGDDFAIARLPERRGHGPSETVFAQSQPRLKTARQFLRAMTQLQQRFAIEPDLEIWRKSFPDLEPLRHAIQAHHA